MKQASVTTGRAPSKGSTGESNTIMLGAMPAPPPRKQPIHVAVDAPPMRVPLCGTRDSKRKAPARFGDTDRTTRTNDCPRHCFTALAGAIIGKG